MVLHQDPAAELADRRGRRPHALIAWMAAVPLVLAAVSEPFGPTAVTLRERVLTTSLGLDHSGAAPTALLLALADLVPVGPRELRMTVGAAVPASLAVWVLLSGVLWCRTCGVWAQGASEDRGAKWYRGLALSAAGLWASVLLDRSGAMAWIALALALAMKVRGGGASSRMRTALGLSCGWAAWVAPAAIPALAVALLGVAPSSWRWGGTLRAVFVARNRAFLAGVVALVGLALCGWLTRQNAPAGLGGLGVLGSSGPARLAIGEVFRPEVVAPWVLAVLLGCWGVRRETTFDHRGLGWSALVLAALGLMTRDGRLVLVASALLAPTVCLGVSDLVAEAVKPGRWPGPRRQLGWAWCALVPALIAGRAANLVESRVRATWARSPVDVELAAMLVSVGMYPPRALVLVDDELGLLTLTEGQTLFGLRPDVAAVPVQGLLQTAALDRTANVAVGHPAVLAVVQGLLARGRFHAPDLTNLGQRVPTLVDVEESAVLPLASQIEPLTGALRFAVERVAASDRRSSRGSSTSRALELAQVVRTVPETAPIRVWLTRGARREARVLVAAGDRDALLVAIEQTEALVADGRPDPLRAMVPAAPHLRVAKAH